MRRARRLAVRCGSCPCSRDTRGGMRTNRGAGSAAPLAKTAAMRVALVAVLIAALAAGCGSNSSSVGGEHVHHHDGDDHRHRHDDAAGDHDRVERGAQPMALRLYFLAPDGKLAAVSRAVEQTQTPGAATLRELTDPPGGMTTEVPSGLQLTIDNGRASVTGAKLNPPALAQVVYALTTFPTVQSVNGKTRADVEGFVPPILVEQPLSGRGGDEPAARHRQREHVRGHVQLRPRRTRTASRSRRTSSRRPRARARAGRSTSRFRSRSTRRRTVRCGCSSYRPRTAPSSTSA